MRPGMRGTAAGQFRPPATGGSQPDGASPNAPVLETVNGASSRNAGGAALGINCTAATCDNGRGINASTAPAMGTGTRNPGKEKVTEKLSRNQFIASELYRPEAPNIPIRGVPRGKERSYCEAARMRPSSARINAQPPRLKP